MDKTKFAAFKYQHGRPNSLSAQRLLTLKLTLGLAVLVGLAFFPVGFFALFVPLIAYVSAPKMIYLGPRYLICGDSIVYYGNIKAVALEAAAGRLRLEPQNGRAFVLEREKFPTNARKAGKIATNKAAKFEKVSTRLIARIRKAAPDVELSGIAPQD